MRPIFKCGLIQAMVAHVEPQNHISSKSYRELGPGKTPVVATCLSGNFVNLDKTRSWNIVCRKLLRFLSKKNCSYSSLTSQILISRDERQFCRRVIAGWGKKLKLRCISYLHSFHVLHIFKYILFFISCIVFMKIAFYIFDTS